MPSKRRSLLSQRLLALVPAEWIDAEDFMERAIPIVPPGQARREYESHRRRLDEDRERREREGRKMGPRKPEPTEGEKLRMGARSIVNGFLGDARDNKLVEVEALGNRYERRLRLSDERKWAHHCCLHGGTCRGSEDDEPVVLPEPDPEDTLSILIDRVLESRRQRNEPPIIREVFPGDIDRLLRECG